MMALDDRGDLPRPQRKTTRTWKVFDLAHTKRADWHHFRFSWLWLFIADGWIFQNDVTAFGHDHVILDCFGLISCVNEAHTVKRNELVCVAQTGFVRPSESVDVALRLIQNEGKHPRREN